MRKKSIGGTKKLSRKNYKKLYKKSKLNMRGGQDRMKVRFFPINESNSVINDDRFMDVMKWLSPDKMLGLIQHGFFGPSPDYIPTDIYWSINLNTGILHVRVRVRVCVCVRLCILDLACHNCIVLFYLF